MIVLTWIYMYIIRGMGFVPRLVNDKLSPIWTGWGGAKGWRLQPRWWIHSSDSFPWYGGGWVTLHVNSLWDSFGRTNCTVTLEKYAVSDKSFSGLDLSFTGMFLSWWRYSEKAKMLHFFQNFSEQLVANHLSDLKINCNTD